MHLIFWYWRNCKMFVYHDLEGPGACNIKEDAVVAIWHHSLGRSFIAECWRQHDWNWVTDHYSNYTIHREDRYTTKGNVQWQILNITVSIQRPPFQEQGVSVKCVSECSVSHHYNGSLYVGNKAMLYWNTVSRVIPVLVIAPFVIMSLSQVW